MWVLLAGAMSVSAALLLVWGSKLTFLLDDWEFLLYRPGFSADSILSPHGEHISAAPVLIYKTLLETAGMSSSLPYLAVSVSLFLASVALLFIYLRRRVDPWLALLGAGIVLFLGPAFDDLIWDFQMGFNGSLAFGLGALVMLERGDRRGDLAACGLLSVGMTFSSLELAFIAAALIDVLLGRIGCGGSTSRRCPRFSTPSGGPAGDTTRTRRSRSTTRRERRSSSSTRPPRRLHRCSGW